MAVLNDEQEMLRDMAREWTKNEHPVGAWRKVRDAGEPFDADAWSAMAEMGWAGIIIPEVHGGTDFGWLSLGLVIEELGKSLAASPKPSTATPMRRWRRWAGPGSSSPKSMAGRTSASCPRASSSRNSARR